MAGPFIVFDLGGTNLRVGVSRDGEKVDYSKTIPTPPKFEDGIRAIYEVGTELLKGGVAVSVAGGIGWALDESRSHIFRSTKANFLDWNDKPLKEKLSAQFNAPVYLYNDVALVGLGEAHVGAGKESAILAYMTVSTGVNGVRIVDGKIDRSTYGFETGKQIISEGTLEDLVSGTAVTKKFGIHPKDLASIEERNKLADLLAEGLYNTILHWSPDTIVLGGSMIVGKNPIPIPRVEETLVKILTIYPSVPKIIMAGLGDNGGLEGARILASEMR